ncbi:hypothetical protein TNCV_3020451 [Trichonephila clavipes]|nr:hypothetical protein TNCV_3020451 [Trichonephila clavipes]
MLDSVAIEVSSRPKLTGIVQGFTCFAQTSDRLPRLTQMYPIMPNVMDIRIQRVPNSPTWSSTTPKGSPKSPNRPPTWSPKMVPTWLYRQDFAKFSLNRHYNELIHLGQDKGLAYCNVLPSVLSVVISVFAPQSHSAFLGLCKDLPSLSAALEKVLCGVSDSITILCHLRGNHAGCSCVVSGLHLLGSHADSFPSQMMHFLHPCLEFLDVLLRSEGCIWWPAEQNICRQTKISSEEHLRWGIAGGFVNGKQEKGRFLVPVLLISEYQKREAVQDGPIEPLYHAVSLRL